MVLSKPLYHFLGFYFGQLYTHPLRTKIITSCLLASSGNLASQLLSGQKVIDQESLAAYALFGFLFGGTIPHYFYGFLERLVPEEASFNVIKKLLVERLIYSPFYHAFALYMITRFEGKTHEAALKQIKSLYWPVLKSSWKYLTIIQFINLQFVPPMLRVLIVNIIAFCWTVYIATKRRQQLKDQK